MIQTVLQQNQGKWTKCRNPIFYIPIFILVALLYIFNTMEVDYLYSINLKQEIKVKRADSGFFVKTTGCRIPFLDPYDKSIRKYVYKVKPFKCSEMPPLINSNVDSLYVDEQSLAHYNITNSTNLDCYYQPFWRMDPKTNVVDDLYSFGDEKYFNKKVIVQDAYVKVVCKVNDIEIYKDFHSFVPIKKKQNNNNNNNNKNKINVLIIGIDSVSRLNMQRQLPNAKLVLTKTLNAIEMIGYNKVGDNTFPNLIPILTGQSEEELSRSCWTSTTHKFDNCPFIWKNYKNAGYLTSFAEDSSWMGVFNYQKRGFKKQPTDFYWRTFNYYAEKQIGHFKPYNADLCMGPRPVYKVLLDYIRKFTFSLRNEPYFGLFWGTSLSHDHLNYPELGDRDYEQLFNDLHSANLLNNTALIVLSDHGMRWGGIRSTHQGHLEERLPFLFFALPPWFKDVYPTAMANMRRNSRRLTTPYDLHETLKDLLHVEQLNNENVKRRSQVYRRGARAISLFLSVPENRTCATANIASHWCTCQQSTEVDRNDSVAIRAAEFILAHMNTLLSGYQACAKLQLVSVLDARLLTTADYLKNNSTIHDYTVILRAKPGDGLFESTVRCIRCDEKESFQMTGTISRLNLYGNQSACITDFHLKLYCYCAR